MHLRVTEKSSEMCKSKILITDATGEQRERRVMRGGKGKQREMLRE